MLIGGGRASLLPAEIYGLVIGSGDISRAAALALAYVVALGPPLLILDRLTVWLVNWLASREPRPRRTASRRVGLRSSVRWWSRGYQVGWIVLLAVLVLAPLYASFVRTWGAGLIATSWTTQWYGQIAPDFWSSIGFSVGISLACIVLSVLGAVLLALAWRFTSLPGKNVLRGVVLVPAAVPGFLWGLSLLVLIQLVAPGLARTPIPLILGEALLCLPFMLRVLMTALEDLDTRSLDVAAGLGAGPLARTWRVLAPLLIPAIGMGSVLVFVRSFGESKLALVLAPARYPTAALWLLQAADTAGIGLASAMDTIVVVVPLMLLVCAEAALRRGLPWAHARAALPV
ncbi:MAG: ABC transporter permease subunit [Chloroflexi bacterium]|nr:ABC transporter permease subunit [Chloroflexota bacterium]